MGTLVNFVLLVVPGFVWLCARDYNAHGRLVYWREHLVAILAVQILLQLLLIGIHSLLQNP